MNGTKPFYQSTGVVGAVFTILLAIAALCGISITPDNKPIIGALALLIGSGVMALMGRLRANTTIGGKTDVSLADVMELLERLPMNVANLSSRASGGTLKSGWRIVGGPTPEVLPTKSLDPTTVLQKDGVTEALATMLKAVQALSPAATPPAEQPSEPADIIGNKSPASPEGAAQPNEPNTSGGAQ